MGLVHEASLADSMPSLKSILVQVALPLLVAPFLGFGLALVAKWGFALFLVFMEVVEAARFVSRVARARR
jgi:hypothetical protein